MFTFRQTVAVSFAIAALVLVGVSTGSGAIAYGLVSPATGVTVPYPGRLSNPDGQPVPDGAYSFQFALYDADSGGTPLWLETHDQVSVQGGSFAVSLGTNNPIPQATLEEGNRWLAVGVRGPGETGFTALTPRQPLSEGAGGSVEAAPVAAACPHDHLGEVWNANVGWSSAGLRINNSSNGPSLWGKNTGSGNGIRGTGTGTAIGVYGEAETESGVAGRSTGRNGVAGYTDNTSFAGVYGEGPHFGVFGRTPSYGWAAVFADGNLEATGNLYVHGTSTFVGAKTGYVVDVVMNDGNDPLELGDVVAITGAAPPVLGEIPVMKVRRATADTTSVVGVVDQHYTPSAVPASKEAGAVAPSVIEDAPAAPGAYLTVVTLGAFRAVKVDASFGAIAPGDLLVGSSTPGYAMKATDPQPGSIIGKALGALSSGKGIIPVLVTLH